ncbi:thiol-disulfide isomerase [Pedobacter sp. PACM 27299]|uniref:thioredoxin family protein n=1 Tax=Pedobacter sp. PACM 27299 TaxID=1727164 RepID=UPI000705A690|nr:thioredoxin family protein [Pedobacter sp. PACM 27299]ALL07026.1 thiol-disulfide isomerase [Pedobacter sp. PACM 27299]
MKLLLIFFLGIIPSTLIWNENFNEAQQQAKTSHKQILINFSGSDWCGPCIRLRKEILESEVFEAYAKENLVLVRADFPRQKKNQLPAAQIKKNESLAEQYNPEGKFPYTILLDENGKILKSWDGYPNVAAEKFVSEIKTR